MLLGGSWARHPRYGRAQGMCSASGSGPYQRFPWCLRTPVTTPPRSLVTGGINHAGVLRPVTPFYPDGWWGYLKGNWGKILTSYYGRAPDLDFCSSQEPCCSLQSVHLQSRFRSSNVAGSTQQMSSGKSDGAGQPHISTWREPSLVTRDPVQCHRSIASAIPAPVETSERDIGHTLYSIHGQRQS